jgi:hypothetical protein
MSQDTKMNVKLVETPYFCEKEWFDLQEEKDNIQHAIEANQALKDYVQYGYDQNPEPADNVDRGQSVFYEMPNPYVPGAKRRPNKRN